VAAKAFLSQKFLALAWSFEQPLAPQAALDTANPQDLAQAPVSAHIQTLKPQVLRLVAHMDGSAKTSNLEQAPALAYILTWNHLTHGSARLQDLAWAPVSARIQTLQFQTLRLLWMRLPHDLAKTHDLAQAPVSAHIQVAKSEVQKTLVVSVVRQNFCVHLRLH